MKMEEFLVDEKPYDKVEGDVNNASAETGVAIEDIDSNIDVQKAVVESLAADKAEQNERIAQLNEELAAIRKSLEEFKAKISELEKERDGYAADLLGKKDEITAMKKEMDSLAEQLIVNKESELSNQISLLDRNLELPDRFPSETRDHVLEALKEARDSAESEGRIRRAQLLEGVLVANVSSGALQTKREGLKKLFSDNQNILTGTVINSLDKCGISYKNGDNYLLPAEIIKRTY